MRTASRGSQRFTTISRCAAAENRSVVLACSALKQSYRERLVHGLDARFVYLKGSLRTDRSAFTSAQRTFCRRAHPRRAIRRSEEPTDAIVVDISARPQQIVDEICRRLGLPYHALASTTHAALSANLRDWLNAAPVRS